LKEPFKLSFVQKLPLTSDTAADVGVGEAFLAAAQLAVGVGRE
jgi:hypothetical protein